MEDIIVDEVGEVMPSTLEEELIRDIQEEAAAVRERARRQGEQILAEARRQAEEDFAAARARLDENLARQHRRAILREELAAHNRLRQVQMEEIEAVFDRAGELVEVLHSEDPERFDALLRRLFTAARALLPEGPLRVHLGGASDDLRRRLSAEMAVEVGEGPLGVIVESTDGRLRCDNSIAAVLGRLRRERAADIGALIFGEGDERPKG